MRILILFFVLACLSNAESWIPENLEECKSWEYDIKIERDDIYFSESTEGLKNERGKIEYHVIDGKRLLEHFGGGAFRVVDSFIYIRFVPRKDQKEVIFDTLDFDTVKDTRFVDISLISQTLLDNYIVKVTDKSFYTIWADYTELNKNVKNEEMMIYGVGSWSSSHSGCFENKTLVSSKIGAIQFKSTYTSSVEYNGNHIYDISIVEFNGEKVNLAGLWKKAYETYIIDDEYTTVGKMKGVECIVNGNKLMLLNEVINSDVTEIQIFNHKGQKVQSISNINQPIILSAGIFLVVVKMGNGDLLRSKVIVN